MKPIPAIVEPAADLQLLAKQIVVAISEERQALTSAARHEQQAAAARETARMRRQQIGGWLVEARKQWPERGPNAKGWGEFLRKVGIDDSTAWRYMDEVQRQGFSHESPLRENLLPDPPPGADDEQVAASRLAIVPEPDADPEVEIDRDTWCSPPWITEAIGSFGIDPCSNERSTVHADRTFDLERDGEDGLRLAQHVDASVRVFVNPPYSDVGPWIAAYKHTRFCFLLKLDTSTKWFAELYAATALILIPRRRVNFIPPPGVPPDKAAAQQFPHALFYAHAEDVTDAIRALCWAWRVDPQP